MQAGNIAHQVVKSVSCNLSGAVEVDSVKGFHDFGMVGNFIIGDNRLAELLYLHVFAVVLTNRYRRIDNLRNGHHNCLELFFKLTLDFFQFCQTSGVCGNLLLCFLCLVLFALSHQCANLLRNLVSRCAKLVGFLYSGAERSVKLDCLVNEGKLVLLEFVSHILPNDFGIFS